MIPVHRICKTCRVIWRCRFIIHLMHALSFGDAASSYIFRMPPDSAIPVHRTPFFSASLGDSGASYIVNTPPYLAMPIQKLTETCHHPPPPLQFGDFGSSFYLTLAPFGDSAPSYVLKQHPLIWRVRLITHLKHLHAPLVWRLRLISSTRPLICRFRFIVCLTLAASFGDCRVIISCTRVPLMISPLTTKRVRVLHPTPPPPPASQANIKVPTNPATPLHRTLARCDI